jgi:CBS domain-containing protein
MTAVSIGKICNREVVSSNRAITIREAAFLMREHHVGDLLVVNENGERQPVGIITDRDITISIVALGLDPDVMTVGDIMGRELVTLREDRGVLEAIERMRLKGVRRLPIVGVDGSLVGIVTVDDLIALLANELSDLSKVIWREQMIEVKTRKSP